MGTTTTSTPTVADYTPAIAALTELATFAPELHLPTSLSFHVNHITGDVELWNVGGLTVDDIRGWGWFLGKYTARTSKVGDIHHTASGVVAGVPVEFTEIVKAAQS